MERRKALAAAGAVSLTTAAAGVALGASFGLFGLAAGTSQVGRYQPSTVQVAPVSQSVSRTPAAKPAAPSAAQPAVAREDGRLVAPPAGSGDGGMNGSPGSGDGTHVVTAVPAPAAPAPMPVWHQAPAAAPYPAAVSRPTGGGDDGGASSTPTHRDDHPTTSGTGTEHSSPEPTESPEPHDD